ncbi:MAG: ArnT family glycosyltransferase [Cyclobacteriaceae bacterium]
MIDQLQEKESRPLQRLSAEESKLGWLILGLLLLGLFLNLGVHPLKHEEPRRALVALEMLFRANFIVPTEVGAYYYNKPPVYNWLIILSYQLFGNYSEFAVRFFSVLSFLGMAGLVGWVANRYVGRRFALYSSLFFLTCVDLLYYFSLTGEIDFFYSLITLGSFLTVFHFYQKKAYWPLFLLTYLLAAIGTLTKGLPSIVFTGITLLVWFSYRRNFLKLFHPAHFVAIFLFLAIVGGYFWVYSWFNDPMGFLTRLYTESSSRTVVENGFSKFIKHLFSFPLTNMVNIMPAALLLPFALRKDIYQKIKEQPLLIFVLLTLAANIIVYLISPGSRARYVYMLYPLMVMVLVYTYLLEHKAWQERAERLLHLLIRGLIIVVALVGPALPFVPIISEAVAYPWLLAVLCSTGSLAILWLHLLRPGLRTLSLLLLLAWARIIFDLSVIPVRAYEGGGVQDKIDATEILHIVGEAPLHVLANSMISRSTIFYLERERLQVLDFEDEILPGHYYMAYEEALKDLDYQKLYSFEYNNNSVLLVKFE